MHVVPVLVATLVLVPALVAALLIAVALLAPQGKRRGGREYIERGGASPTHKKWRLTYSVPIDTGITNGRGHDPTLHNNRHH